jgi:hypothetical protein
MCQYHFGDLIQFQRTTSFVRGGNGFRRELRFHLSEQTRRARFVPRDCRGVADHKGQQFQRGIGLPGLGARRGDSNQPVQNKRRLLRRPCGLNRL